MEKVALFEAMIANESAAKSDKNSTMAAHTASEARKESSKALSVARDATAKLDKALGSHSKTLKQGVDQSKQARETARKASASASEATRVAAKAEARSKSAEDTASQAIGATKEQNKRLSSALSELLRLSSDITRHSDLFGDLRSDLSDVAGIADKAAALARVKPKAGEDGSDGVGIEDIRDVRHGPDDFRLTMFLTDGRTFDLSKLTDRGWAVHSGAGATSEARVIELIAENGGGDVAGTEQKTYHQRFTSIGAATLNVPLTAGKKLRLKYFNFVGSPDNTATENVTLQWAGPDVIHSQDVSQYGQPHATSLGQNYVTGDTNELPEVVLTVGQTVDVNIRYEEVD
jgi:hypothetical protein